MVTIGEYLVVIKWDYYEMSTLEFDTFDDAKDYFNFCKEEFRTAESIYLTKMLEEVVNEK